METIYLNKLKKRIDRILDKFEEEALAKGVNVFDSRFHDMTQEVKKKILNKAGYTLKDYEDSEKEKLVDEDEVVKLAKHIEGAREKRKKEFTSKLEETSNRLSQQGQEFKDKLTEIVNNVSNNFSSLKRATKEEKNQLTETLLKEINKVRSEIPIVPKHNELDHVNIIRDLNNFENEIESLKKENKTLKKEKEINKIERDKIDDGIITALEKLYKKDE